MIRVATVKNKPVLITTLAVAAVLIVFIVSKLQKTPASRTVRKREVAYMGVAPECACVDSANGRVFDFCYSPPLNRSVRGRRFSCDSLKHATKLHVLDANFRALTDNMANRSEFPLPTVFVAGASENHFHTGEMWRLLGNLHAQFPRAKIIFYDMGLSGISVTMVKSLCNVEYRRFRFEKYPRYVGNLFEYRWKPIIIAETLAEYKMIWWTDASIIFNTKNLSSVYNLLSTFAGTSSDANNASLETRSAMANRCDGCDPVSAKFPYLLHLPANHSIFAAFLNGLYDYIPPQSIDILKSEKAQMFGAGFALVVRTKDVIDDVLKWWLLCALEEACMAPRGHYLYCNFTGRSKWTDFADCHRYDQATLNLLLANKLNYDYNRWSSGIPFYSVHFGATNGYVQPQLC